jgi:putative membrane protein
MRLLLLWLINAVTLLLIPYLMPSVSVNSFYTALITALILGLVNSVIRPILVLLTLPITIVTLGLFILVINGLMFWFVASFIEGFHVAGFWSAFWGAIVYGILSTVFTAILLPRDHPRPVRREP